ncbi:Z-ring formation inhibitor MciZ [Neobacillus cucumis]|nr:Z-ring formation inhibitor MciZ [Neobacillus cucumis]MBM7651518.1 sulfur relay (sulfurtransferase) DsrC/TusE family protein [Neobacillus cucumis]MED4223712.1 Z-ring formation inhibitor MciZ [Neobacillus cucumis]
MKIYINEEGITLVGKAWEIVQKLKEYNKEYELLTDWIQDIAPKK